MTPARTLARLWSLVKPRIVALLCLTGLCALLSAGGAPPVRTAGFLVAGAFVAGGSAALNCWYDRDIDRHMERTADRPLPRGALSSSTALAFALCLLAVGTVVALATLPTVSVAYMWAGVASYVGLYTGALKRRSRLGVVLGGSAGSFPVLAGWTAVRPLTVAPVLMATLVFVWTPAHAWALAYVYRDDFARVDVPTLPAVSSVETTTRAVWYAAVATVVVALVVAPFAGPLYAAVATVASACLLHAYWTYRRVRTEETAVRAFFTSNCYLAAVFLAWAVTGVLPSSMTALVASGAVVAVPALFALTWAARPSLRGVEAAPFAWRNGLERIALALRGRTALGVLSAGATRVRDSVVRTEET